MRELHEGAHVGGESFPAATAVVHEPRRLSHGKVGLLLDHRTSTTSPAETTPSLLPSAMSASLAPECNEAKEYLALPLVSDDHADRSAGATTAAS